MSTAVIVPVINSETLKQRKGGRKTVKLAKEVHLIFRFFFSCFVATLPHGLTCCNPSNSLQAIIFQSQSINPHFGIKTYCKAALYGDGRIETLDRYRSHQTHRSTFRHLSTQRQGKLSTQRLSFQPDAVSYCSNRWFSILHSMDFHSVSTSLLVA